MNLVIVVRVGSSVNETLCRRTKTKKTKNKETKPFPGVRKMAQCLRSLTLALGPSIYMQAHDRL